MKFERINNFIILNNIFSKNSLIDYGFFFKIEEDAELFIYLLKKYIDQLSDQEEIQNNENQGSFL